MLTTHTPAATDASDEALLARLRAAAELLEEIARDRGILARVPDEDRKRLLGAIGIVFSPDINARRRLRKEAIKQQKASVVRHEDRVYADTGIRKLRRETVFTTPNVFPPSGFDDPAADGEQVAGELSESIHCYVCKQHFTVGSSLLRSALPGVRASSISRSARSSRICADAWRCSPAGA